MQPTYENASKPLEIASKGQSKWMKKADHWYTKFLQVSEPIFYLSYSAFDELEESNEILGFSRSTENLAKLVKEAALWKWHPNGEGSCQSSCGIYVISRVKLIEDDKE